MRFIVAIVSFIVAFLMISFGIAQRTFLAEPDHVAATAQLSTRAPLTVIDGKVLNAVDGRQKVTISGGDTIFAAYGTTSDVLAWVGDASYNKIGIDKETTALTNKVITGSEADVPDPRGSDLWLAEYTRDSELTFIVNVPSNISIIVLTDEKSPAPSQVSITWPVDNRTPWSGPLIVGGMLLLLIGLGLYLWALSHLRKARGPRRKPPKMPKMPKAPKQLRYKPTKRKAVTTGKGRRSASRLTMAVPVLLVGALTLSSCSAESWPEFLGGNPVTTPSPKASGNPLPPDTERPPVVTVSQFDEIMSKIARVAQTADADRDTALITTRFAGSALELRAANYAIRTVDNSVPALSAIPSGPVKVMLPQQNDKWPRTVFAVTQDPQVETAAPTAVMLVQETPRDNYKVVYSVSLRASATLPKMAAAEVGTQRLQPDTKILAMPPDQLATDYGDILLKGATSEFVDKFDMENDPLVKLIGFEANEERKKGLSSLISLEFGYALGAGDVIAMASIDSGAIVAVYLTQTETVKPTEPGAVISAEGNVKSLSGVSSTTKGTVATYGIPLLFYVPSVTSSAQKIILLGSEYALIAAKELS